MQYIEGRGGGSSSSSSASRSLLFPAIRRYHQGVVVGGGAFASSFSWFHVVVRFFPFLLVSALTSSPLPNGGIGINNNQNNNNNNNNNNPIINNYLNGITNNGHINHNNNNNNNNIISPNQQFDNTNNGNSYYPWNNHQHIFTNNNIQSNNFQSNITHDDNNNNNIESIVGNVDKNSIYVGPPRPLLEEDQNFLERVQVSIQTVQNWDNDIELLKECRTVIPWDDLRDDNGPYSNRKADRLLQGNALFLQRLCRWFPKKFMNWVNTPPCKVCGNMKCEMKTVRSPETQEEKEGEAKRVEVYYCPQCKENTTTFPRYNRAAKLLETRQGRCGEYSNLFGLFCRAVGFETRLVLDLTDHLWTEVRLGDSWIMADACEGIIDKPSMYEYGWGKDGLCYMLAIGSDHIIDVTSRYTRQYLSEDFQTRRRAHTSSEDSSAMILKQFNVEFQANLTIPERQELARHLALENVELRANMQSTEWTPEEKYGRGRISGSRQWRQSRGETNSNNNAAGRGKHDHNDVVPPGFEIETLAPPIGPTMSLLVRPKPTSRHNGIAVLDTPCAVGQANCVSVVVVDEACLGCILQSRSFLYWQDVKEFIDRLPSQRIVLMNGKCSRDDTVSFELLRLGGWKGYSNLQDGILYIGQIDAFPDWTFCSTLKDCPPEGHEVVIAVPTERPRLKLRHEIRTMPQRIAGRLPEYTMPLQAQLLATEEEKQRAFTSYCSGRTHSYCGYTSKPHCPVYLLDGTSYPLERMDDVYAETDNLWNTFHYLPATLVPEDDAMIGASSAMDVTVLKQPKYTVPLHTSFFSTTFGRQLIGRQNNNRRVPTSRALRNSRLVGLYFASQWVDACRNFTPLLAETYDHLKQVRPVHGLEIVFVSTDRDPGSFESSFSSMPWHAIPFDQSQMLMENLSRTFDVQRTSSPNLVILDSVSGKVIVSASESQQEVVEAYRGGQKGVEHMFASWLERTPPETQILLSRMGLPYKETKYSKDTTTVATENPYLFAKPKRSNISSNNPFDAAVRIFDHFVGEGIDASDTQAVTVMEAEARNIEGGPTMQPGPLNGKAIKSGMPLSVEDTVMQAFANAVNRNSHDVVFEVLGTAQFYVRRTMQEPWSPNVRTFYLSNNVADRITCAEGGLALIQSLGLEIFGSNHDFKATIPVSADLDELDMRISYLLQELRKAM